MAKLKWYMKEVRSKEYGNYYIEYNQFWVFYMRIKNLFTKTLED